MREVDVGVSRPGVDAMVPREQMTPSARKLRDTHARVPGIALFKREPGCQKGRSRLSSLAHTDT